MTQITIPFDNSYARLPETFYARLEPRPVKAPGFIVTNNTLARELNIDPDLFGTEKGLSVFSGSSLAAGSEPLAMAYAGHQFGGWVPQLGDGRALLLGEVIGRDGIRRDIQLKGSGPTPYSRMGDGRSALGPALREYIVSEAMHALGIPTTRALCVVSTGEHVVREGFIPGGIVTRVAKSHVRVGTFQYFAARQDTENLKALADYVIERHYPDAKDVGNPYAALYGSVVAAQASLVSRWMGVGFIHGVMNTDNVSVAGETIDYGPCAFMDTFHPGKVFSSIDHQGRYAYANQPNIQQWNLARLAEAMLPLFADDRDEAIGVAQEVLNGYPDLYEAAVDKVWAGKLGLASVGRATTELCIGLLDLMAEGKADFTCTFRALSGLDNLPGEEDAAFLSHFENADAVRPWLETWRKRLKEENADPAIRKAGMLSTNPAVIPRNHRVEEALAAVVEDGNTAPLFALLKALETPFDETDATRPFMAPPQEHEIVRHTFCGT